jgi:hypothetical protein
LTEFDRCDASEPFFSVEGKVGRKGEGGNSKVWIQRDGTEHGIVGIGNNGGDRLAILLYDDTASSCRLILTSGSLEHG